MKNANPFADSGKLNSYYEEEYKNLLGPMTEDDERMIEAAKAAAKANKKKNKKNKKKKNKNKNKEELAKK